MSTHPYAAWYKTADWQRIRAEQLNRQPYCQSPGCHRLAGHVDHVIPHRGNRTLFDDRTNLQSLCESCHNRKSQQEKKDPRGRLVAVTGPPSLALVAYVEQVQRNETLCLAPWILMQALTSKHPGALPCFSIIAGGGPSAWAALYKTTLRGVLDAGLSLSAHVLVVVWLPFEEDRQRWQREHGGIVHVIDEDDSEALTESNAGQHAPRGNAAIETARTTWRRANPRRAACVP